MEFDKAQFIDDFKIETRENLQKFSQGLLKLEKAPGDRELLNTLFRAAHTLKGISAMMDFKRIVDITHIIEDGLQKVIKGKVVMGQKHYDVLLKALDAMDVLLEDKVTWEDKGIAYPYVDDLCREIECVFEGTTDVKTVPPPKSKAAGALKPMPRGGRLSLEDRRIRVDTEKLDTVMNLSGEMLISKIRLNEAVDKLELKAEAMTGADDELRQMVSELSSVRKIMNSSVSSMQAEVISLRMVPVSYLFSNFPRAMRDLAHEMGKDIEFEVRGGDTRLDKTIVDELKDPLMHILRNAVDHGIEDAETRTRLNKPKTAKVILEASQQGVQVVIRIADDGGGINIARVKEKALSKGLITKEFAETMTDNQAIQLLFLPGFSTKDVVTDVSGRGVGLDVVKETITKLKGMVDVNMKYEKGTEFLLKLPLTLAITQSLIVASGSEMFAIPLENIVETIRINPKDINTVEGKEAIAVRDQILPLVRLSSIFHFPAKRIFEMKYFTVVVVQSVEKKMGFLVDRLFGRQEIVRKAIGNPLKKTRYVAGATILGNGRVILILDAPSIVESSEEFASQTPLAAVAAENSGVKTERRKKILLAEDSVITAALEKNILESAGYTVVHARDGKEALGMASQEKFNIVISDVLMPKMDGIELTSTLKKDSVYKNVPVIIVTTRENETDRRRGLEAGADKYMLKSEFTSDALLSAVSSLVG